MFSGTAGVAEERYLAIGAGVVAGGEAALVEVNLTGNERAACFACKAVSETGEVRTLTALGLMEPEVGWRVHSESAAGLTFGAMAPLAVRLSIASATEGERWIGSVEALFTQDYAA